MAEKTGCHLRGVLAVGLLTLALVLTGCRDEPIEVTSGTDGFLTTTRAGTTSTTSPGPTTPPVTTWARSDSLDAQFLIQATFGPTRSSLADLKTDQGYEEWILRQMSLDASSLRSYYRSRVNPSGPEPSVIPKSVIPRTACEQGSRWSNVAFDRRDVGLPVVATGAEIFVNGKLRTKLDPGLQKNHLSMPMTCTNEEASGWSTQTCPTYTMRPWHCSGSLQHWVPQNRCQQSCWDAGYPYDGDDCSVGWPSFIVTGYVCAVDEAASVGGLVFFSTSQDCQSLVPMRIPAIWLDGLSDTDFSRFDFVRPHIIVLASSPTSCTYGDWIQVNGSAYRHDPRLKLVDATSAEQETCVAVPSSMFNLEQCKVQTDRLCEVSRATSNTVNLTADVLERISSYGRYVFEIAGLQTSASPCSTLSRWKECTSCTTSALSTADKSLIVSALESSEGSLRDVYVPCTSVSANAVVSLSNGELFQHVHIHEGNIYDFTDWALEHPGGQNAITKWTTNGFKLQYPASHPMDRFQTHLSKLQYIGKSGEQIRYHSLPTTLKTEALALELANATVKSYSLACPSPGETASVPRLGHDAHFWSINRFFGPQEIDFDFDFPSGSDELSKDWKSHLTKLNMWIGHVMSSSDQLRQRMAWALSQVLVVGTGGFVYGRESELWTNYYDILARKAFGNYLDLLKEVTFSPLMAEYLSFLRNSAYDHDQNYPDENYAREVMQLFTIGTVKLNLDGSKALDGNGNPIPTYNNEDIMTFARVFTGLDRQLPRANFEEVPSTNGANLVDSTQMIERWHDSYPKQDLDKNYLGDGLPLCSELPKRSFLMQGARYEFLQSYSENALQIDATSALYKALCGSESGVCAFKPLVLLEQDLACSGNECNSTWPHVVELTGQGALYEYVPPPCMHFYFFEGRIATGGGDRRFWESRRVCANPATRSGGSYCCAGCSNIEPSWFANQNRTCDTQRAGVFQDSCKNDGWWVRNRFCEKRCFAEGQGYDVDCSADGSYREDHVCGFDLELAPLPLAEQNCEEIGMKICDRMTETSKCGYNSEVARVWTTEPCSVNISVHVDGKVASHHSDKSAVNQITVNWYNGPPDVKNCPDGCTSLAESCWCPTRIEIQAVFDRLPTPSELSELKVGAFKPQSSCSVCGEVNAFFEGESFDTKTIFEYQNKFYRNIRSVVFVGDKSFRNPPVVGPDSAFSARSAIFEIETLLEHLVYHPNTAPFISYRFIQRFVTSSPSAEYVQAVATAFRTGRYGRTYSGQYGDLGATIAAILLHPEAREMNEGAFREPLIKLVHFLRAMEFEDPEKRTLLFEEVIEKIGQEPFASPTVFNFYMPDYELPSGQVAPEFQIFDPATAVNLLNGMFSLIDHQGVTECKHGLGVRKDRATNCELQDSFKLPLSASTALSELDLLLTGGRMTNHTKEAVMQHSKNQNDDVKAVQEASVLTPEFHTLGAPRPLGIRPTESETGGNQAPPRSYKAVVNLYLNGGADSFNLLVPINCALHDEYLAVRGPAALSNNQLLEISSTQACRSFGLHHKFPKLRAMYQAGEAAFVSNIGSLVAPLTKYEYKTGATPTCVGLFSHSDQTAGAQTLKCQVAGGSPKGVAGRLADALTAGGQKFATNSFSLHGKKTWSEGFNTLQQAVDSSGDIPTLENSAIRRPLIENITKEKHGNVYSEEYAKTLGGMIDNVEYLAGQLQNVTLSTTWPEPQDWSANRLLKQFKTISKLVASRTTRKAEREFFYVELGGFDTHNDVHETLDELFALVDEGLDVFVKEMKAQGVFESVVLVTTSDFGRTMTSNGKGTDHGWAGNTFVLGGNIRGGEIYNEFPASLVEGNLYDVGRGRMIPKYPWESVMLPIAEWMGMDAQDKSTVFPNLQNFNSSRLLPTSMLFNT